MNIYLNTKTPLENFKILTKSKFFIDKSMILKTLNIKLETSNRYICITKPRRFGKTSIADMLGAYYSKAFNSREVFDKLNISKDESYEKNINKYNVINISFNKIPENGSKYSDYISMIKNSLIKDIEKKFFINKY